eukprot:symbB.v1.2.009713.t1/scaffold624.1/size179468/1
MREIGFKEFVELCDMRLHSEKLYLRAFFRDRFRGASSNCIQPHLRDVAEALQGVKNRWNALPWTWDMRFGPNLSLWSMKLSFMFWPSDVEYRRSSVLGSEPGLRWSRCRKSKNSTNTLSAKLGVAYVRKSCCTLYISWG